jgi:hypothetical protein
VYKFLRFNSEQLYDAENNVAGEVPWNFSKFIVDGQTGQVFSYYNPRVSPLSLRNEIETLLNKGAPYLAPENPVSFGGLKVTPADVTSAAFGASGCGAGAPATAPVAAPAKAETASKGEAGTFTFNVNLMKNPDEE